VQKKERLTGKMRGFPSISSPPAIFLLLLLLLGVCSTLNAAPTFPPGYECPVNLATGQKDCSGPVKNPNYNGKPPCSPYDRCQQG
jgi:hypothetical protein